MGILDTFARLWTFEVPQSPVAARSAVIGPAYRPRRAGGLHSYMAASNDRLMADLNAFSGARSANAELRMALRPLRARSRHLAANNEWVKSFLRHLRDNVAGPRGYGLQMKIMQVRGGKLDSGANTQIEAAYAEFSKLGTFSACGRMGRSQFERACVTNLARDGEILIELVRGYRGNRFAFAVRFLDPDLLDESLNAASGSSGPDGARLADGHEIRMGVEVDGYTRPIAYWLLEQHPNDDLPAVSRGFRRYRRVPASQLLHRFLVDEDRPGATRGVPLMTTAIRRMAMLGGFEEAALVTARVGASKMGFYVPPGDDATDPSALAQAKDDGGNLVQEAEPGVFEALPPGWDFKTFDPAYPNEAMPVFVKHMLRAFASGVGISYNAIAGDLESVNYSSLRQGALADRDLYESLQAWQIETICEPIFEIWLGDSLAMGAIGRLPADEAAQRRFNVPRFVPRGWKWVDPLKEIQAEREAIALGVKTRSEVCAERGRDFEEVLQQLAQEQQLAYELGVVLGAAPAAAAPASAPADDPEDDDPNEGSDD